MGLIAAFDAVSEECAHPASTQISELSRPFHQVEFRDEVHKLFPIYQRCKEDTWDSRVIWNALDDAVDFFAGDHAKNKGFSCGKLQSELLKVAKKYESAMTEDQKTLYLKLRRNAWVVSKKQSIEFYEKVDNLR